MKNEKKFSARQFERTAPSPPDVPRQSDEEAVAAIELELAVEWGERIATGKAIARGGKANGEVPGASPQTGN